jgi:hypothetical protein
VVYHREQQILLNKKIEKLDILSNDLFLQKGGDRLLQEIKIMLFGFCGRIFPLYWRRYYGSDTIAFSLDLPQLAQALLTDFIEEEAKSRYSFSEDIDGMKKIIGKGDKFSFDNYHFDIQPFVDFDSPIFLYSSVGIQYSLQRSLNLISDYRGLSIPTIVINFCLKTINFHKHLDQFQAYQEIEQFLGNTLVKREKIIELDDKSKRNARGFDDQSFKSLSPGKKAKRQANKLLK